MAHVRWHRSIKGRLVALFLLLALGTTAVFLFGMQRVLHAGWSNYARPLAADYADRVIAELGSPPEVDRARALVERLPITLKIEGPVVQFDSAPQRRRHYRPADESSDDEDAWGLVRRTADGHRVSIGLARPPHRARPRVLGWATLATLLLLTGMAYFTVRRLLAPLQTIGAGAEAYGRGDFATPIPVKRRDELGLLTERVNDMASNLSGMLEAKRTLLLAISHELRSPLTRARVNAELVEEGEARQALLRDLGEMRDLITGLLESERLVQGHAALQAEPIDLPALVREVAEASEHPLQLQVDASIGPLRADPTRLRLLLRNLIANAARHGAGPTLPALRLLRETDGLIALGVRDYGPGVPDELIAQLGQAFYRPDSARTRSAGGVGLGLYLCRLVAQAHGGELRIRAAEPGLEVSAVWRPAAV